MGIDDALPLREKIKKNPQADRFILFSGRAIQLVGS